VAPEPGAIDAADHVILVKLNDELLDWIVAGKFVKRQWFVYVSHILDYGSDIASVFAGLGIGAPIAAYLKGEATDGTKASDYLRQALPSGLFGLGIGALAVWAVLRVVANRQNVAARALFAEDFARTMELQWRMLLEVLRKQEPMTDILQIQRLVDRKVAEATEKDILQWDKLPPNTGPGRELEKRRRIAYIHDKFMAHWTPLPNEGR
jgi:hypothetical protein